MKPRISIITLAVDDLEKSLAFYRDGLGLPTEGVMDGADHVLFRLEGNLSFVLYPRSELAKLAQQSDAKPSSVECILSHSAATRQEVDTILKQAEAAGGTVLGRTEEQPWGYYGHFKDLDGHVWEVICGPAFAVEG
jgi:predicted lactoylglutathione lyase